MTCLRANQMPAQPREMTGPTGRCTRCCNAPATIVSRLARFPHLGHPTRSLASARGLELELPEQRAGLDIDAGRAVVAIVERDHEDVAGEVGRPALAAERDVPADRERGLVDAR